MKKLVLALVAMFMAANAFAEAYVTIKKVEPTTQQDYLRYETPNDIVNPLDQFQNIVTDIAYANPGLIPGGFISYIMQHFLVECVAGAEDFKKGVTENNPSATRVMPARAKVVGLDLPGTLLYTNPDGTCNSLKSYVFLKNLDNPTVDPPYKDVSYSKLLVNSYDPMEGDNRYFYKPENNYLQAITKDNAQRTKVENGYVLKMTFDAPFEYDGNYVHIAIELSPCDAAGNESQVPNTYSIGFSFPKTESVFKEATIYHSNRQGNTATSEFNFYPDAQQSVAAALTQALLELYSNITQPQAAAAAAAVFQYFNFQNYTLPAFQLTYYTNDIRGTVHDANGDPIQEDITKDNVNKDLQPHGRPLISLFDVDAQEFIKPDGVTELNTGHSAEVNEDGSFSFSNLDHTHTYELMAESSTCGFQKKTINFDTGIEAQSTMLAAAPRMLNADNAIKNDLVCDIEMSKDDSTITGIEEVSGSASPVAVEYYNVAGMRSDTPFEGVNIVVTRYSNGTVTTHKAVKF